MKIKEGVIYINHTCESFDPITGHENNKYDEHLIILNIYKNGNCLVRNLDDGHEFKINSSWFELSLKQGTMEEEHNN